MQHTIFKFSIFLTVYKSTLISSSCLTLVVSPPILSSPPYTDIPGISFVSSSLPPAWSLQVLIMMYQFWKKVEIIVKYSTFYLVTCNYKFLPMVVGSQDSFNIHALFFSSLYHLWCSSR